MPQRQPVPYRYPKFTEDAAWLEAHHVDLPKQTACCARCRRGVVPGQFPCGRPGTCPNPDCAHAKGHRT